MLRTKHEKSKDYCTKLIQNKVYCVFITIFRLAIPAFIRFIASSVLVKKYDPFLTLACSRVGQTQIIITIIIIIIIIINKAIERMQKSVISNTLNIARTFKINT